MRFGMKQQEKQRHSIAGQRWYEKLLDRITSEENFRWSLILLGVYVAILLFGTYILANVLEWFDISELFFNVWSLTFPLVALVAMINPWAGVWRLWSGHKLQKPILEQVEQHGSRTYDELVSQCMPLKIHLGIDDALEWLLRTRELVLYVNEQGEACYRLPTEEDRENWHREFLKENGETLTVEELHRILSMDSRHFSDGILIWFSLGEQDGFWMGKTEREDSDEQAIWIEADDVPYQEFMTFEELIQTKLIRGKSLYEIWDELVFFSIEGESPSSWYDRVCGDL